MAIERRAGEGVRVSGRDFFTVRTKETKNIKGNIEGVTSITNTDIKKQQIENQVSNKNNNEKTSSQTKTTETTEITNNSIKSKNEVQPYKLTTSDKLSKYSQQLELQGGILPTTASFFVGFGKNIYDTGVSIKNLATSSKAREEFYTGAKNLITKPSETINAAVGQSRATTNITPAATLGSFFSDVAEPITLGKVGTKIVDKTSDVSKIVKAKITGSFILKEEKQIKKVPTSAGKIDINIVNIKEAALPLREQVKIAGTTGPRVSAQKSFFNSITRRNEVLVNKPKITPKDSELERSTFFDPRANLRESRLGINQKKADVLDIITGDFTGFKQKPQILIAPSGKVEKIPNYLSDIKKSLQKGKPLTKSQQKRLSEFQLTPSGKFKPIGFVSTEAEVTVAPNEIIKKEAKLGTTIINNKPVDIFEISIKKPKQENKLKTKINLGLDYVDEYKSRKSDLKPFKSSSLESLSKSSKPSRFNYSSPNLTSINLGSSGNKKQPPSKSIPIPNYDSSSTYKKSTSTSLLITSQYRIPRKPSIYIPKKTTSSKIILKLNNNLKIKIYKTKNKNIKSKQNKKLTPTLFSAAFNKFGKSTKGEIISGLGIRPIRKRKR